MQKLSTRTSKGASRQLSDWDLRDAAKAAGYRLAIHGLQDYRLYSGPSTAPILVGDAAAIASHLGLSDVTAEPRRRPGRAH